MEANLIKFLNNNNNNETRARGESKGVLKGVQFRDFGSTILMERIIVSK